MRILSFDIEEWFHILDNASTQNESDWARYPSRIHANMERILTFLDATKQAATFFCLGWIAEKYPEVIHDIVKQGHEIASHTHTHQLIYTQTPQEFKTDLQRSLQTLEQIAGKKVRTFRAPGFSIKGENLWAFDILAECGIEIDSSIFPANRAHGGIADFECAEPFLLERGGYRIKEFPINVASIVGKKCIFSGGGYFRLLPYPAIRRLTHASEYVMTYFHPRDFDPEQPMIAELSRIRRFKSYYALRGAFEKLQRYTRDFDFVDLAQADAEIDWTTCKVIRL